MIDRYVSDYILRHRVTAIMYYFINISSVCRCRALWIKGPIFKLDGE